MEKLMIMPKTKKRFDWEIYDKEGNYIDILTFTRAEAKEFQINFPDLKIREIGYTDDD